MKEIKICAIDGVIHISTEEFKRLVADIRADEIEKCIEKLYEATPQTADEKLDMVFVNALRELKEQKNGNKNW